MGEDHEIGGGGAVGVDVDLLGLPLLPLKDPRGRPAFAKTQENQMVVMTLRAKGQSVGEIATFLRCDEKTVRKHFSRELDAGASLLEGIAMQVLVRKMLEGSVGATRAARRTRRSSAPRSCPSWASASRRSSRRRRRRPRSRICSAGPSG